GIKCNAAREERIDATSDPLGPHPATRLPTPSAIAIFREQYEGLVEQQVPETRDVAQLRYEGNTFPEIAEQLGMHEANARKVMRRLKRRTAQPPEEPRAND